MQARSTRPVKTFTIGFAEQHFDETPFARAIAGHLRTEHTELTVTPREALEVIPRLARIYDEPFADSSQLPTFLVCALARKFVTVSLSGDGGDELFGGYDRYPTTLRTWATMNRLPAPLRRRIFSILQRLPWPALQTLSAPATLLRKFRSRTDLADRLQERACLWQAANLAEAYDVLNSQWKLPEQVVLNASGLPPRSFPEVADDRALLRYIDSQLYLPDDILAKVDRAAMAVSLETRVPLLDPEVVTAAWRIPSSIHWHDGRGKWILRTLLERYVPRALFDRPKCGFAVPIASWLRGELQPWAHELLDPSRLRNEGFFADDVITRRWRQHLSGDTDWSFHLWSVLMFQSWLQEWSASQSAPTFAAETSNSTALA
jgi:asparagine synthase (glutamine-hydrolysing)